jgi:hypothetical protein
LWPSSLSLLSAGIIGCATMSRTMCSLFTVLVHVCVSNEHSEIIHTDMHNIWL